MTSTPIAVAAEVREALTQFLDDYVGVVDSGKLEHWDSFFTDDCRYRVIARENHDAGLTHCAIYCKGVGMVRDRAGAIRDSTYYAPRHVRHFLGRTRVTAIAGDVIDAHTSFQVVESISDKEPYILMVGEYIDRIVGRPGAFRFQDRTCVYDNYRIFNSLVYPV